jgi:hypothetical protein
MFGYLLPAVPNCIQDWVGGRWIVFTDTDKPRGSRLILGSETDLGTGRWHLIARDL